MGSRTCLILVTLVCFSGSEAAAQPYEPEKARRHFVSVSYDFLYSHPLHFAEHPLEDLLGRDVASGQTEAYDYRTRDGATTIDVVEFGRRTRGASVSLYPLGVSSGATLMLRGAYEQLPDITLAFTGPAPVAIYELADAKSIDGAVGVIVADRSPGWGLGSHAFVAGGVGRITSSLGDGRRYFAEAGGGMGVGPLGVELGVKFAWNTLAEPVDHRFLTVPITLRGTLTF